jgi:hypothetical protein
MLLIATSIATSERQTCLSSIMLVSIMSEQ